MVWLAVSICLLQIGCSSAEIRQPWWLERVKGQNATFECTQDNGHNVMFWYWKKAGQELQYLFYFNNRVQISKGNISARFTADQPQTDRSNLKIASVKTEDSAVYFCASSPDSTNSPLHFGEGTRLTVLESINDISPPSVTIFDPSIQELKAKQKVTIVCVVTDFYPDHVNLTWSVDGNERTEGVKTEEPKLGQDEVSRKKFSWVSRLRITRQEWEKIKEFQCTVYFDPHKNETFDILTKSCDSDAAEESYLRSINFGKLIYILLIFKSLLYGAFVTICMLRKKSMKENPFS